MFTGLVEGVGRIDRIEIEAAGIRIELVPPQLLMVDDTGRGAPVGNGDSIAINGCCLTLVARGGGRWSFQAGEETLSKTNLRLLSAGNFVNLERSLPAQGRIGGHFVQGHIDGTGIVDQLDRAARSACSNMDDRLGKRVEYRPRAFDGICFPTHEQG